MNRTTQWLNENRYRRYPLATDTDLRMATGQTLPLDLLLDFQLAGYDLRDGLVTLQGLTVVTAGAGSIEFTFRHTDRITAVTTDIAVTIPGNASNPFRYVQNNWTYSIELVTGGGVDAVLGWGDGTYAPALPMQLEPALFVAQGRHRVSSLLGDVAGSVPVSGDVYFEEGYGVRLTINRAAGLLIISAVPGAGAGYPCNDPDGGVVSCSDILLMLNGAYGGALGALQLVGGRGVGVESVPADHELRIRTLVDPTDITCQKGRGG